MRRLERAFGDAVPAGVVPLAPITLMLLEQLDSAGESGDAETVRSEYRRVAHELQRQYLAGNRDEWLPVFAGVREELVRVLKEPPEEA